MYHDRHDNCNIILGLEGALTVRVKKEYPLENTEEPVSTDPRLLAMVSQPRLIGHQIKTATSR